MVFFNVKIQEMFCGEVLLAFETAIGVRLRIMDIVLFERGKCKGMAMWWEGALHFRCWWSFTALEV